MKRPDGTWFKGVSGGHDRERAWQSMRILRQFTLPQLQVTSGISYDNAKKLVQRLEQAGYLVRTHAPRHPRPGAFITWALVRNTGPAVPIIRQPRTGPVTVWDPNLKQELRIEGCA
jgi:hypothetical protein